MAENDDAAPKPKRRQIRKRRAEASPAVAGATAEGEVPASAGTAQAPNAAGPKSAATSPTLASPGEAEVHGAAESTPLIVTIFGGSGFIGRRLVAHLLDAGARVKVVARTPEGVSPPGKSNGSVESIKAGIDDYAAVRAAVAGSTAVVNLVGILHEGGGQTFESVHVEGAKRVAAAAKAAGVLRLVHMSALGASPGSPSRYARTKAAGEDAVRSAFPEAGIVRPSIVFGPEDDFFNRFAAIAKVSPALLLIGGGATRFQPVYVDDAAVAIVRLIEDEATAGQTYELGGPAVYSFKELMEMLLRMKKITRVLVPVPFFVAEIQGSFLQMLPTPPLTRDQVELLKTDNVLGGSAPGLHALGITPTPLEAVLPTYL